MWVYVPSTYDGQGLEIQAASFTSVTLGTTSRAAVDMSLRDQWQRVYQPFTPDSGDLTGDVRLVRTGTAPTAGHEFVYVDGVQVETQPTPTPYIHTDGSTVQRLSSYLRFPIHLIDIAEGWGVAYVRPAWAAALAPDVYSRVLDFNVDASNGVHIYYNYDGGANTKKWAIKSEVGGNADDAFSASQSFTNETAQVVGGVWTRSQVGITVDGAAPTMASRSNGVPDISGQTYFNLGKKNEADSMWLNGEALGMAVGKGPMPSGGFAKVNSLLRAGVGFPNLYPGYCTAVWDGRSTVYRERI